MPVMDPFEGAKSEREDSKKQLLDVIAQSGAAGKEAYNMARKENETMRQGALGRAQQRAQLTGQNLGGADTAAVGEAADRYNTYFTGQEAAHQAQLGGIGASAESYLAKVGQIAPFMQQKALDMAADRENQYKMEIAANQAKIDAEKAAEAQAHQRQIELLNLKNQFDIQADARAQQAAAAKERASGAGSGGLSKAAQKLVTGPKASPIYQGMDTGNITRDQGTGPFLPPKQGLQPPPMDHKWIMDNVIMPGTTKKATASRADEVLRAPEVKQAQDLLPQLASLKRDPVSGRYDEPLYWQGKKLDVRGSTPREVFEVFLSEVPGIRTMKEALRQYYGPYLDALGKV